MDKITQSIKLACEVHEGQADKGNKPYIFHCLHVMKETDRETQRWKRDKRELAICAAILHDVLEDCKNNEYIFIERKIYLIGGKDLVNIIQNLSRKEGENYNTYIEILCIDPISNLIKIADIKHNMDLTRLNRILDNKDFIRLNKYKKSLKILEKYNT